MIFAPFTRVNKLNGFIHKYHIDYSIKVSSTHLNDSRIPNPLTNSTDRWCSISNNKFDEWYMVNFTRSLYITHFVLWSLEIHNPLSWYAEGCNKNGCQKLVTYQKPSIDSQVVFPTPFHGPFDSFRMTSTGKDSNNDSHHCI